MQGKLNMLKKQINKISHNEPKHHKRTASKKYESESMINFSKTAPKPKKISKKGSRKNSKSHIKSNSFATTQNDIHSKNPIDTMVKKGPVNIINIKNYNILKSDQKKIEREEKSSGIKRSESLKKPYKSGSSYGKKS